MYALRPHDVLLDLRIAKARARARSGERRAHPERRLLDHLGRVIDERLRAHLRQRDPVEVAREALGPDHLIPYGDFLRANGISYDLGQKLRDAGQLKVLRVGGKLMVRRGHAAEFARSLPLE